jgi:uncharacterized protein (TIGR02246 family)
MSDEIRRIIDEAAIRRVIDRYCHAVDRGTADDVAALFHPDGRLVANFEENDGHNGREAVRDMTTTLFGMAENGISLNEQLSYIMQTNG